MFEMISVLVPTRKRLGRVKKLLESFDATSNETSEIVFRVDEDDTDSLRFLRNQHLVVGPRMQGYASMPTFFNELAAEADGDVLLCGNDDMVFRSELWDDKILEEANKYQDGLFDIGVSTHNETHYPFSIVSRKVVDVLGFLWDPRIFWGDIFLRDVMGAFDRCVMLPSVNIDHEWVGFKPDQTWLEGNQHEIYQRDPSYWQVTHAIAVREAVEKLRKELSCAA